MSRCGRPGASRAARNIRPNRQRGSDWRQQALVRSRRSRASMSRDRPRLWPPLRRVPSRSAEMLADICRPRQLDGYRIDGASSATSARRASSAASHSPGDCYPPRSRRRVSATHRVTAIRHAALLLSRSALRSLRNRLSHARTPTHAHQAAGLSSRAHAPAPDSSHHVTV